MASATPSAHPASSPPQHGGAPVNPSSSPAKRDLKSWWKNFTLPRRNQEQTEMQKAPGIFGIPLRQSIQYANVAISLEENGQSYIYGYVPIVVAKCATGVEGIFRLSGSEKRIKELKTVFDSPDRYGKGLSWDGYTVHDAANVFRRYLNDLPEPVVPLDLYEKFREPLRGATKQAVGDAEGPQYIDNFDENAAIEKYQKLITELPPLNMQLLLYILDLLAVFAAKSEENRMTSQNLAAIFQPGMLSHPDHAMAPEEYRLNQCVIIFLIENQDHFLIGMHGTAADETTRRQIESGPGVPPVTPTAASAGVTRSASNASAGAASVRREGQIRRNRSVNSRHSRKEDSTGPNSPALSMTPTGGLGRSNTVPSKKSPAIPGGKFRRPDNSAGPHSPSALEPLTQSPPLDTHRMSEQSSLAVPVGTATNSSQDADRSQERLLSVPQDQGVLQKERNLSGLFNRSPTDDSRRQPNKLKKKRIPGSMSQSAQSSNTSLPQSGPPFSPTAEQSNPLEQTATSEMKPSQPQPLAAHPVNEASSDVPVMPSTQGESARTENFLRSQQSPSTSLHSSYNDTSDREKGTGLLNGRSSEDRKGTHPRKSTDSRPSKHADTSQTSLQSFGGRPKESFTGESSEAAAASADTQDSGRDEPKGPLGWIRHKYREAKETAEQRRNKSPPPSDNGAASFLSRGKSVDIKREPLSERRVPSGSERREVTGTEKANEAIAEESQQSLAQPAVELEGSSPSADREAEAPAESTPVTTIKEEPTTVPAESPGAPTEPTPHAPTIDTVVEQPADGQKPDVEVAHTEPAPNPEAHVDSPTPGVAAVTAATEAPKQ
ncbi:Rho-GTPase-activating protein-like protein [Emericellopsis cladophorae]|uniref:Rho-GTPase-activating protein-like protein n=1 Tax=Emericellopsis cladophorae TaxID=2686198 RepID=A0A9P9XWN5_9HYPO|nr:Rho-GTPase-activating protein-like protein [Emericellopsis cladophorae]KAI6778815.1 Rho-GTPase-activating protein-like protein [Emericellopsis cladophorae]